MDIKPIHTESDYESTLARIDTIFDAEPNTPEGDELEILAILVEDYEKEHYPIQRISWLTKYWYRFWRW